jgi:hypothetical protein
MKLSGHAATHSRAGNLCVSRMKEQQSLKRTKVRQMKETSVSGRWCRLMIAVTAWLAWSILAVPAAAGPYRDSAHGNSGYGVNRSALDQLYTEFATGNCGHCHEAHASVGGIEPAPTNGPAPHALFADSFDTSRVQNFYLDTDNFCFYCHNDSTGQQVRNQDYSSTFGGGTNGSGPQSILEAFNQASYHNLYDIWNFLNNDQTYAGWFATRGNPCSACHNSHLAKRNWDSTQPGFPLLSAISMPGMADNLWGETEVMSAHIDYEAPYALLNSSREPAGVGDPDGAKTPDYIAFCISCHNSDNTIWSTALDRELTKINWNTTQPQDDKHGALPRDGTDLFREPYAAAAVSKTNFILSCLDCHEPHGSENSMLLRRRINGENLEGAIASTDAMSYACKRCHQDDLAAAAGTGEANRWEHVHHLTTDAPYAEAVCTDCHAAADGSSAIACGNCHGHGRDDSSAGASATGRKTF